MIRILSVDDHPLLRKGIAALVNVEPDMKLVAEACNGEEAIQMFRVHRPDVTLMDRDGFQGVSCWAALIARSPFHRSDAVVPRFPISVKWARFWPENRTLPVSAGHENDSFPERVIVIDHKTKGAVLSPF